MARPPATTSKTHSRSRSKSKTRPQSPPSSSNSDSDSDSDSQTSPTPSPPKHTKHTSKYANKNKAGKKKKRNSSANPSSDSSGADAPQPPKKKAASGLAEIRISNSVMDVLGGMTGEQITALVQGRKSVPMRLMTEKFAEGGKEDEASGGEVGEENDEQAEAEVSEEEELEDEEDMKELEERAQKLSASLAVPFEQLRSDSVTSLTTSLAGLTSSLQSALEPFHGGSILQQLQIWQHEKAGVTKVGNAGEGWDAMIVMVKNHKDKMDDVTKRIKAGVAQKVQIVRQGKNEADAALERQAAELLAIRADLAKSRAKYTKKMEKATDKVRIQKEVNMAVAEILKHLE